MSSTLPSPDNDYLIPLQQAATREFLQRIFKSIGMRLRAAEATEADYQGAIDLITTQALAVVSANVAEEVEAQRANLAAIQRTLDDLLAEYEAVQTGGVPASGISVAAIAGLPGANVQAVLLSVKTALAAKASSDGLSAIGDRVASLEDYRSPFTFAYAFR